MVDVLRAGASSRATARLTDILANGIAAPSVRPIRFPSVIAMEANSGAKKSAQGAPLSREDFLQSATMLINDQGYVGASVERISAALNVTKGSFYHHLNTKDELVAACFHRSVDIILSAFLDAEANNERAIDILVSATSAFAASVEWVVAYFAYVCVGLGASFIEERGSRSL